MDNFHLMFLSEHSEHSASTAPLTFCRSSTSYSEFSSERQPTILDTLDMNVNKADKNRLKPLSSRSKGGDSLLQIADLIGKEKNIVAFVF